jgi:hypothetical protein
MSVKLGIVVPYRDRAEHLAAFIPHLHRFFQIDLLNSRISVRILISEQTGDLPFNRGFVNNAGYKLLAPEIDYVCFHDVDLLPEKADYRGSSRPAMLISEGLNASFTPGFILQLFSAVVLMEKSQFARANGFSNQYWGWGFEDVDLRERLLRVGCSIEHRAGRFKRLPHVDAGSFPDGRPTPDHLKNQARYAGLWFDETTTGLVRKQQPGDFWNQDGLSNLGDVHSMHSRNCIDSSNVSMLVEHILIEPLHRPALQ